MNWNKKIEDIIRDGKWTKNSIRLGRVQCGKLVEEKGSLALFIVSDILMKPLYTKVEKMVVADNEIVVFYDEKFGALLEEGEYEKFSRFFNKEEWDVLFGGDTIDRLDKMELIHEREGFYIEPHETMEAYLGKYDQNATKDLCSQYNL
ncbi:hypothetical protein [Clostridium brassicae]|uniref:Uncharacterized protein n=1 Tax=Clostridium brassicae TaxID=2999072 RepID=A0ABT4DA52_9CLOT|nr:hypothetical protein [Clostridium brassicae]MCY6959165.1 hypothetical protein [Clostridium brassicae]